MSNICAPKKVEHNAQEEIDATKTSQHSRRRNIESKVNTKYPVSNAWRKHQESKMGHQAIEAKEQKKKETNICRKEDNMKKTGTIIMKNSRRVYKIAATADQMRLKKQCIIKPPPPRKAPSIFQESTKDAKVSPLLTSARKPLQTILQNTQIKESASSNS